MKNGRPIDLYPLLAAMDHPISHDKIHFEKVFCQGHWTQQGDFGFWNCKGASQLEDLSKLIRPLILNRKKSDVLNLPPKIRKEHVVNLNSSELLGFDHRLSLIIDNYQFRIRCGLVQSDAESLAVLSALRQISAEFKLPSVTAAATRYVPASILSNITE